MFLELIAVIFAGIAAAGVVMLLGLITGGRLPKWLAPVAAGVAMLGVTVSNEYTWFGRTSAQLPGGVVVIETVEERTFYRPWTYVVPYVRRFVALDEASLRRNPQVQDQRMADLYLFGRWAAVHRMPVLVDCAAGRLAQLADGASFGVDGTVTDAAWDTTESVKAMVRAVCGVA
jgi:hypothetical protein